MHDSDNTRALELEFETVLDVVPFRGELHATRGAVQAGWVGEAHRLVNVVWVDLAL